MHLILIWPVKIHRNTFPGDTGSYSAADLRFCFCLLCLSRQLVAEGNLFSGRLCVCPSLHCLREFHQIYNLDAVGNKDEMISF